MPRHAHPRTDGWSSHQQPGECGALPRSSASQKRLTWTENRQGFLEVDASSSLPSPFIFPPAPEKKVPLSRATRRRRSHEVRATWLGLDAKVIKVVDRPPRGERFEDGMSRALSSASLFSKGLPQGLSKHLGVNALD